MSEKFDGGADGAADAEASVGRSGQISNLSDRLLKNSQAAEDIDFQRVVQTPTQPAASSEVNINNGRIVGADIQMGNRTYHGIEAATLRSILQTPQNLTPAVPTATRKILFLASSPIDQAKLRLDIEMREIANVLRQAKQGDRFELVQRWAVRPDDLQDALLDLEPEIVHFSGHGLGSNGLVLEDNNQKGHLVSTAALTTLFKLVNEDAQCIKCVVLNACFSDEQAVAIRQHVSSVTGMQSAIGDAAAINFAKGFYRALGNGRSFENAFGFGCNAIDLQNIPEHLTPVFL